MKVLVPVDGSEHALEAVRFALRLGAEGAKLSYVLLHVQEPAYLYELMTSPRPEVLDRLTDRAGREATEQARALLDASKVTYELVIASGEAATKILDEARTRGCDFIVLGSRGRGAMRDLLLGTVSSKVIQIAPIPVTVVRSGRSWPRSEAAE